MEDGGELNWGYQMTRNLFLALSSPETLVSIPWGMKEKKGPQK